MRKLISTDLVGKTIKSIDSSTLNSVKIEFEDDSEITLFAEVTTPLGIASILVEGDAD